MAATSISRFAWDRRFGQKLENRYDAERNRLKYDPVDLQSLIKAFLSEGSSDLDPPVSFRWGRLEKFMEQSGSIASFTSNVSPRAPPEHHNPILLDDREDTTGNAASTRLWDSEIYMRQPPEGERVLSKIFNNLEELRAHLDLPRKARGAERRTLHIQNITPSGVIILAATAAERNALALRRFLHYHLSHKAHTEIAIDNTTFIFEFHLPIYTLRKKHDIHGRLLENRDKRRISKSSEKPLRTSRPLPLARHEQDLNDIYHEAQLSFLIIGVDEWFWTAYCCVDSYFDPDNNVIVSFDAGEGTDAPSGGNVDLDFPFWNPREYFLIVLSRRIMQATREFTVLVNEFEERMNDFEDRHILQMRDPELILTTKLTEAVATIRRFRDTIARNINAWENFEAGQIRYLDVSSTPVLQEHWETMYMSRIRGNIAELKALHLTLTQKLELFNGMRNGLVNASALNESTVATRQGEFIKLLTRITVLYLPLSLANGIFSVSMVPENNWIWIAWVITLVGLTASTLYTAAHPKLLNYAFPGRL